jgi:hypothetical protein
MADAEIVALREKLTNRPRSDDYRQRRRDISMNVVWLMDCNRM